MSFPAFIQQLTHALAKPLPGLAVQQQLLADARRYRNIQPNEFTRESAVLLAFYPNNNRTYLPLILRPPYDGTHGGQMALPGGGQEPDDESLIRTALREAQEEIGIKAIDVQVIGQLSRVFIPPSNYWVQPVVGFLNYRPEFYPDPVEVAEIVEVSTEELLTENALSARHIVVRGQEIHTPGYWLQNQWVWGATALMLAELIAIVRNEQLNLPYDLTGQPLPNK